MALRFPHTQISLMRITPHVATMETHGRCTDSGVIFALKWRVLYPYGMISEVQDCVHVGPFCLFVYVIYFLLV